MAEEVELVVKRPKGWRFKSISVVVSLGKTAELSSAVQGSSQPLVCECVSERGNERPL